MSYPARGGGINLLFMSKFLESAASRIIIEAQRIGANLDPEILSWPGGYFIAVSVCLYARAAVFTRGFIERRSRPISRTREDHRIAPLTKDSR
jgi:hypothetical protein